MLRLWNRMVLFSLGVRIPFDVVLCGFPLFVQLLPQRSEREIRSCCFCHYCPNLLHFIGDHTDRCPSLERERERFVPIFCKELLVSLLSSRIYRPMRILQPAFVRTVVCVFLYVPPCWNYNLCPVN